MSKTHKSGMFNRITTVNLVLLLVLIISSSSFAQKSHFYHTPDALIREGIEQYNNGNYQSASGMLDEYLGYSLQREQKALGYYYRAMCDVKMNSTGAERSVEKFVEMYPEHPKAAIAFFELGNIKYAEKKYGEAIKLYNRLYFSELDDKVAYEARFKLGYCYFTQKQFKNAYAQFNVLKKLEHDYTAASNYYSGYINFQNKEYNRAFYDFKRAEENDFYGQIVPSLICKVLYKQLLYDDLIKYANEALKREGLKEKEQIHLYLAEAYYFTNAYDKAADQYNVFEKENPKSIDAATRLHIADTYYRKGWYEKAMPHLEKVAGSTGDIACEAAYFLGNVYINTGQKKLAPAAYLKATSCGTETSFSDDSQFNLGKVYLDLGDYNLAIEQLIQYDKNYAKGIHTAEAKELLAEAYVETNRYEDAIRFFEQSGSNNPRIQFFLQKATLKQAEQLYNEEEYLDALAMINRSLNNAVNANWEVLGWYWKGEILMGMEKYEEAVNAYAAVFRKEKNTRSEVYLQTRYGIGYAYFNLQKYDRALSHFKYYTDNLRNESTKSSIDAGVRLADCYFATRNYQDAISTFSSLSSLNNQYDGYISLRLGTIRGIQGDVTKAQFQLDKTIAMGSNKPFYDDALYQKGQIVFEAGNYVPATDLFTSLIEGVSESPFVPYAFQNRALCYFNLKKYDASIDDYKDLLFKYPRHPLAYNAVLGLQETLSLTNRSDELEGYMSLYKTANPENKGLEELEFETAKNHYYNQNYDNAIRSIDAFLKNYPESAQKNEAQFLKADAFYRLGKDEDAIRELLVLTGQPNFSKINKVYFKLTELYFESEDYQQTVTFGKKLEEFAANKKDASRAWSFLMESYAQLQNNDSTIYYGKQLLEKASISASIQTKASLYVAKAYLTKNDNSSAMVYLEQAVGSSPDIFAAEAKYLIAFEKRGQDKFSESNEVLFELINTYSAYQQWMDESFLLLAENYISQDEVFQAKATLQSIAENAESEAIVNRAVDRLNEISEEEEDLISVADTLEIVNPENE